MSYRHDEIDDDQPHAAYNSSGREVTLSTGTILGIFFGLVLLCAVFFGFGYNMGSKSHQAPIIEAAAATAPSTTDFNSFKPASGTPANQAATAPKTTSAPLESTPPPTTQSQPAPIVRTPPAASTKPPVAVDPPAAPAHAAPASEAGLTFVVQVAAVSHQEDADLLVAALKRKGYSVNNRTEPQDKLFHIQIGPFPTKKDAEAMRQRLLADGYNAILK